MSSSHAHGGPQCREMLERLSEYIDGELDLSACQGIEEHLEDCPPCKAFLESLKRTVALVERVQAPALPDSVRREIIAAYEHLRRQRSG